MAFKEVTALRKEGKLDEALAMAREDYEFRVDPYSASALFWTLRLVCERALQSGAVQEAQDLYDEMQSVFENLEDSDGIAGRTLSKLKKYIKENPGWEVFNYLKENADTASIQQMKEAVDKYLALGLNKPSRLHSMILFYSVRFASKDDSSRQERLSWFRQFFEAWGMGDGFMEEDWVPNLYEGKKLPSLAEKAVKCYSDAIETAPYDADAYRSLLEKASEKAPENENILRKLASQHHSSGNDEEAVRITKNLIKTHPGKYYFWYELAQYVGSGQLDICIACCAKALLSTKEERFLAKVHIAMGSLLVKKKMYAETLCEAERYRTTCVENNWSVRAQYSKLVSMVPSGTVPAQDNHDLYKQLEAPADEFIYSDVPGRTMVLTESFMQENKMTGKKRLMFVLYDKDNHSLKINPNAFGLDRKTRFGTCFDVKVMSEDGRERVLSVRQVAKTDVLSYKKAAVDNVNETKRVVHVNGQGFDMVIPMDRIYRGVKVGDSIDVAYTTVRKDGIVRKRIINTRRCL